MYYKYLINKHYFIKWFYSGDNINLIGHLTNKYVNELNYKDSQYYSTKGDYNFIVYNINILNKR